jgi:uncharacterized protein YwqG
MNHLLYQQAYQLIDSKDFGPIAVYLKQFLKPAISMDSHPLSAHTLPLGASKLGGVPDLPFSFVWPTWQGVPMVFLAQIQLQEIESYDGEQLLPRNGFLYFFCQSQGLSQAPDTKIWESINPYDPQSWKVLFFDGNRTALRRASIPLELVPGALLPNCSLQFGSTLSLPPASGSLIESLHLTKDEIRRYESFLIDFDNAFLGTGDDVYHHHWLLGYPPQSSGNAELLCQMAKLHITSSQWAQFDKGTQKSIASDALEWVHLLTIDTDEYAQITWGEYGSLSYWIKRTDLKGHNFEDCWAIEVSL